MSQSGQEQPRTERATSAGRTVVAISPYCCTRAVRRYRSMGAIHHLLKLNDGLHPSDNLEDSYLLNLYLTWDRVAATSRLIGKLYRPYRSSARISVNSCRMDARSSPDCGVTPSSCSASS